MVAPSCVSSAMLPVRLSGCCGVALSLLLIHVLLRETSGLEGDLVDRRWDRIVCVCVVGLSEHTCMCGCLT